MNQQEIKNYLTNWMLESQYSKDCLECDPDMGEDALRMFTANIVAESWIADNLGTLKERILDCYNVPEPVVSYMINLVTNCGEHGKLNVEAWHFTGIRTDKYFIKLDGIVLISDDLGDTWRCEETGVRFFPECEDIAKVLFNGGPYANRWVTYSDE